MAASSQSTDAATVGRAYFEAVGRHDLDAMTALYEPGGTGEIHGLVELQVPTSYRAWFGDLFAAFPDFELEIVEVVAEGDKAVVRWSATGTFSGSARFEGLDPNGAKVDIQGCDVLTVRDGRIQRNDAYMNAADLARQLGALPPAGSPVERVMTAALNIKTHLVDAVHQRA
ncbi:MAG TPA: nuclear transport factor 2 family protein [Solirubrobacterales bacterium]|nr:nuclear transport factor 2 family protein [Solirubrobacterales bacterium]